MQKDHYILITLWIIGTLVFIAFVWRKDLRKGILTMMIFQTFIWLFNMFLYQYGFESAPVRELPKAHEFPLTIDYFFHPLLFSLFYLYKRLKIVYLLVWVTVATAFDVIIEKYTDLLQFGKMTWYLDWLYLVGIYVIALICCNLFYKNNSLPQESWKSP